MVRLRIVVIAAGIAAMRGRALAGSGPAKLVCASQPGAPAKLKLDGLVPHSEEMLALNLSDSTASIKFSDDDSTVHRIEHLERGVFVMTVVRRTDGNEAVVLYAVPKTVRGRKSNHSTHLKFDAIVRVPNPQRPKVDDYLTPQSFEVRMSCSYDNEI